MYIKQNDIYDVYDGEKLHFTLEKICKICDIEMPKGALSGSGLFAKLFGKTKKIDFSREIDVLYSVSTADSLLKNHYGLKNHVLITAKTSEKKNLDRINDILAAGNIVLTDLRDERFKAYPNYIHVESGAEAWVKLGQYILSIFDVPRVSITGSVGKSTTSLLTQHIFSEQYRIFCTGGNRNTYRLIAAALVKQMNDSYEYVVQEVGGGQPRLVERGARVLESNYFCITNIWGHHTREYKTLDNILFDKASLDRYAADGAVGVINGDDERLMGYDYKSKVVSCGIKNTDCDYVAKDIVQKGDYLYMTLLNEGAEYKLKVNILGEYNAYNIMYAFALAKEAGIPVDAIIKAISSFKLTDRKRQFSQRVAGRQFIVDCFNVSANSIKAGVEILDKWSEASGKKIAFIGGENRVGKARARKVNYEIGKTLAEFESVKDFVIYGHPEDAPLSVADSTGDSFSVFKGLVENSTGKNVRYEHDMHAAADFLKTQTQPGDVLYFKGHVYYPMWPIIDEAFGTNYYYEGRTGIKSKGKKDGFRYVCLEFMEKAVIEKSLRSRSSVIIPDEIDGIELHAIGEAAFKGKTINEIDFGSRLKHIGTSCFAEVEELKSVDIPENCLFIGEKAFYKAPDLEDVVIRGARTVDTRAFAGCKNLRTVTFMNDCETIYEDAFDDCEKLTIKGPAGSCVEAFAKAKGIGFETI